MKLTFSTDMQIPEDFNNLKNEEVAFKKLQSRTETYLTETGYQDFEIRPALDIQIAPAPDSEPEKLSFDWEIVEFTEKYCIIQLKFENPEVLSSLDG